MAGTQLENRNAFYEYYIQNIKKIIFRENVHKNIFILHFIHSETGCAIDRMLKGIFKLKEVRSNRRLDKRS
jgi:hypothetical protein